jgi:hypothetical protein
MADREFCSMFTLHARNRDAELTDMAGGGGRMKICLEPFNDHPAEYHADLTMTINKE